MTNENEELLRKPGVVDLRKNPNFGGVALVLGLLSMFYSFMTIPWGIIHEWEFAVVVGSIYWFISLLIFYVVYCLVHGQEPETRKPD